MGLFDRLQEQADANRLASLELTADTATTVAPIVVSDGMGSSGPLATDLTGAGVSVPFVSTGTSSIVKPLEILVRGQGDNVWNDSGNASRGYKFVPLKGSVICPGGVSGCSDSGWMDEIDLPDFDVPEFLLPDFNFPDFEFGGFDIPPPNVQYGAEAGCASFCYDPKNGSHCGPCNRHSDCDIFNVFGIKCGLCTECQETIIGTRCVDKVNPPHCGCANHPGCGNGYCQPDGSCRPGIIPPPVPPATESCICAPICWNTGCRTHCVYMNSCSGYTSHVGCESYGGPYSPYGYFNGVNMYPTSCGSNCSSCHLDPVTLRSTCIDRCAALGICYKCNEKESMCVLDRSKCDCINDGHCGECQKCSNGSCIDVGGCNPPPWGCPPCHYVVNGRCAPVPNCECTKSTHCGPCSQCVKGKCVKTGCKGGCTCTITTLTYRYLIYRMAEIFVCTDHRPASSYICYGGYYYCHVQSELAGSVYSITGCNAKLPPPDRWPCVTGGRSCPANYMCSNTPVLISSTSVQADGCGSSCHPCFPAYGNI